MELLVILAVVLIYFILTYNSLVSIKNNVRKAWVNIDVLLKQRHDELPKLIEACKAYMKHEQETLAKVVQARSAVQIAQHNHDLRALSGAEAGMKASLGQLFALVESYPDLKADKQFRHLQTRISVLENQIADRREFYNDSVNINNVRVQQFPDLIIAKMFNFESASLLTFTPAELAGVDLATQFKA